MSRNVTTLGFCIGEANEGQQADKRGYTEATNNTLAGDNATPLPSGDVACAGFKPPRTLREPEIGEGVSFRAAMADQHDDEDKLSFARR